MMRSIVSEIKRSEMIREVESKKVDSRVYKRLKYLRRKYPLKDRKKINRLREKYKNVSAKLNRDHSIEATSSLSEKYFYQYYQGSTRLKVMKSVWIGFHCIDVFVPRLMFGIEIDGTIHVKEFKMRKDAHRDKNLFDLGFTITTVDNDAIDQTAFSLIKLLQRQPLRSAYYVARMWRDIYLFTLLVHAPSQLNRKAVVQ